MRQLIGWEDSEGDGIVTAVAVGAEEEGGGAAAAFAMADAAAFGPAGVTGGAGNAGAEDSLGVGAANAFEFGAVEGEVPAGVLIDQDELAFGVALEPFGGHVAHGGVVPFVVAEENLVS